MKRTIRSWKLAITAIVFGVTATILSGCLQDNGVTTTPEEYLAQLLASVNKTQLQADLNVIDDSLTMWGITALKEEHGVRYTIDSLGSGATPTLSSVVTVKYAGKLLSTGAVFDSNQTGYVSYLYNFIIGWQTAMTHIPEGSKVTLYIPSSYAYGADSYTDTAGNVIIPANSNLIFEVELIDVQ